MAFESARLSTCSADWCWFIWLPSTLMDVSTNLITQVADNTKNIPTIALITSSWQAGVTTFCPNMSHLIQDKNIFLSFMIPIFGIHVNVQKVPTGSFNLYLLNLINNIHPNHFRYKYLNGLQTLFHTNINLTVWDWTSINKIATSVYAVPYNTGSWSNKNRS